MGRSKTKLPKGARSYGFWEGFASLSIISSVFALLIAGMFALIQQKLNEFMWPGIVWAYTAGAVSGHVCWAAYMLDQNEQSSRRKSLLQTYEMMDVHELNRETAAFRLSALLGYPFVLGPFYIAYQVTRFFTNWIWTAVPFFAGVGWVIGGLVDRPIGFASIGIFVAILIVYKRNHPGLPPAPAE